MIEWAYDDGGRSRYFKGDAGDCVTRAIAIASQRDYKDVYEELAELNAKGAPRKNLRKPRSARNGINTNTGAFRFYMHSHGFMWTPTMQIGQGCKVHLRANELPKGRIVCSLSKHYAAVIDGQLRDTFDSSRNGTRCVYGFWVFRK